MHSLSIDHRILTQCPEVRNYHETNNPSTDKANWNQVGVELMKREEQWMQHEDKPKPLI